MKLRRAVISIVLILSILASTVIWLRFDSKKDAETVQEAQAAVYDDNGKVKYLSAQDVTAVYGTKENPFTILEIVPYAGYAEMGYLTGGQEPVNLNRLCRIAMGEIISENTPADTATEFIEHLVERGYLFTLTEKEAEIQELKNSGLTGSDRRFSCYQYRAKQSEDDKCYVANTNSFLRESAGLKYVWEDDEVLYNEFDVDAYEFLGWYDKDSDLLFDFSEKLFKDVELYAKWRIRKSDGSVENPVMITPPPSSVTPAGGFPEGITVSFVEAVPATVAVGTTVEHLPEAITGVMTDGKKNGLPLTEPDEPVLSGSAGTEYVFRGWYLERDGVTPYRFGSAIPEGYIKDGKMTLYTVWEKKQECTVTFDAALPEEYAIEGNAPIWPAALSGLENGSRAEKRMLKLESGERAPGAEVQDIFVLGNVDYRIKNFCMDVITVTPEELNKGGNISGSDVNPDAVLDNLGLIEKANLIVMSPQSHFYVPVEPQDPIVSIMDNNKKKQYYRFGDSEKTAVQIWEDNINTSLFSVQNPSEGDTGTFGFLHNDLCWEAALAIFHETVLAEPKAALIYDAESYHMALLNDTGATSESPKKILFGEKTEINVEDLTGRNYSKLASKNNVYKLYLMMNQMSPQLFAATFLTEERIYTKMHGGLSTGCYDWKENTEELSNEGVYWNTGTFLLCLLLDEADGQIRNADGIIKISKDVNPWEKWGVIMDLYSLSDNKDDFTGEDNREEGLIKGNCFTYESDEINLTDYFSSNREVVTYQRHVADVYEYYGKDADATVTMSEILYYLIQMSVGKGAKNPNPGYNKNIRILELQPSESYLNDITWDWNINTYIDGFRGEKTVTRQNSGEFIAKVEDLNSCYDLLYIGSDNSACMQTKVVYAEEVLNQYKGTEAKLYSAGKTVILAESLILTYAKPVAKQYAAYQEIRVQIPQTLLVEGQKEYAEGAKLEVTIPQKLYIRSLTAKDSSKYEASVFERLQRGESVDVEVQAGDVVVLDTGRYVKVLEPKVFAAGETLAADQNIVAQSVWEYVNATEWMPIGAQVVLAEDTTLKALEIPEGTAVYPYSYVHTGAVVDMNAFGNTELSGTLGGNNDTINRFYHSGNDITNDKVEEILDFAEAGYPVIIASRLMKRNNAGALEVNKQVVDSASNMYRLLSTLAAGENDPTSKYYGNLFYEGTSVNSPEYRTYKKHLLEALTETKCELLIEEGDMPVLYADGKPVEESYLNGGDGNQAKKNIEIRFKIVDAESANYQLRFYIDQNADGRFEESERLSGKIEMYEMYAGKKRPVSNLKSGRYYTMSADLKEYVGIIPWKLEVVRSDNPIVRDSVTEYSAILPESGKKPTLRVLQVIPDEIISDDKQSAAQCSSVYLPTKEEVERMEWLLGCWEDIGNNRQNSWTTENRTKWNAFWEGRTIWHNVNGNDVRMNQSEIDASMRALYQTWKVHNFSPDYVIDQMYVSQELSHLFMGELEDSIPFDGGSGGRRRSAVGFWLYIRAVKDFKIEVTRMQVKELIAKVAEEDADAVGGDASDWILESFDMVILGFNDCYQDIRDDAALKVIEAFIDSGKQILFTHDTTSFRNYTNTGNRGITGSYWGYNINRMFRDKIGMDRFGTTLMYPLDIDGNLMSGGISISEAISKRKDAPYAPGASQDVSTAGAIRQNVLNSYKTGETNEAGLKYYTQGYSDLTLYRFIKKLYTEPLNVTSASKVNSGQLTEYPYRVGNDITTAVTHEQYYQLDMEEDDIVVWYTLEGTDEPFAGSRHDARNNYYLYSRGNIIYTGVGHNSYLTKDELKLFVNTFVASYRVPADPPTIKVKNSMASAGEKEYFYIDFDSWDDTVAIGAEIVRDGEGRQYQRVRFSVEETVTLRNQKLTMEYFLAGDSSDGVLLRELTDLNNVTLPSGYYAADDGSGNPYVIQVNGEKLRTYSAETKQAVWELEPKKEYYVDVPLELMQTPLGKYWDNASILLRLRIQYGRYSDQYIYDYQRVELLRRGLYDLD